MMAHTCPGDFSQFTVRRAIKLHKCVICQREIESGEPYVRVTGKHEGQMTSVAVCGECAA